MSPNASKICFGLSQQLDRESMEIFLSLAGRPEFATTLASRLDSSEIIEFSDHLMKLIRAHFSEDEYHRIFLNQPHGHKD